MNLLVLAKEPVPGRVKTRLCPPCSPAQAADLAAAALADTLAAALGAGADRVVLALDGGPGAWLPAGVEVVEQRGRNLAERLAGAWEAMTGPTLQIGMDTPQLGPDGILAASMALARPGADAVLGLAVDGGWWGLGMVRPRSDVFHGIATSRPDTGARQHRRLLQLGMEVVPLPVLRDVDTFTDACVVASTHPASRFARAVRRLGVAV
ncbi:DUF2064 domain-containing protein [soil metagenome]